MTIDNQTLLVNRLLEKSKEAFIFAIEIINKPTAKHRSENFVFNICNAWELMLKAKMVKNNGEDSIYFKGQKDRTIELKQCINAIFTDYSNPVKKNIETIQKLRNKSTHWSYISARQNGRQKCYGSFLLTELRFNSPDANWLFSSDA